jgi:hypothetical protein
MYLKEARVKSILILSLILSTTACVDQPDAMIDDSTDVPRIALNGLTPTQLWNASLTSGVLNSASVNAMAATVDGRSALSYLVGCALPSGTNVTATVGGFPFTFYGQMGIAPSWTTDALTDTQQRWVSSCLLGRVNKFGTNIYVSLRGTNTGFSLQSGESRDYKIQEGAFWGNVFQGPSFYAAACNGVQQAANDTYGDLPNRECAEPDPTNEIGTPCGYEFAGTCTSVCGTSGGFYVGCTGLTHGAFAEVATSYLYGAPQ